MDIYLNPRKMCIYFINKKWVIITILYKDVFIEKVKKMVKAPMSNCSGGMHLNLHVSLHIDLDV